MEIVSDFELNYSFIILSSSVVVFIIHIYVCKFGVGSLIICAKGLSPINLLFLSRFHPFYSGQFLEVLNKFCTS